MLVALGSSGVFGQAFGPPGPPAVVALHGWGRSAEDFTPGFGPGSGWQGGPVLAVDLPGFGSSPAPATPLGSAEMAVAVAAALRAVGAERPVVVGHSLGGRVAVRLAAASPELLGGLVLCGAPLVRRPGPPPPLAYRLARFLGRLGLLGEARLEAVRQRYGSEDYRRAQGVLRASLVRLVNEDYREALEALAGAPWPIELVWGERDTAAPPWVAEEIRAVVPQARLTVLPGVGHLVPLECPGALPAAVARVLAAKPRLA